MYKAMIVDDDVPMIKYLQSLLPWEELGVRIAATSYSSLKALQLFQEAEPHLVITDIGLPQMDGIELANAMRSISPDVRLLFLTCHEDFQYARKALQLSADDYLIKDELTADKLKASVEKSLKLIRAEKERVARLSYHDEMERHKDVLKTSFWNQLIAGGRSDALLGMGKRIGVDWRHPHFLLAVGSLDYASFLEQYRLKDAELIHYALYNIAQELAEAFDTLTIIPDDEAGRLVFVLNFQRNLARNVHESFRQFVHDFLCKAKQYVKTGMFVICSGAAAGPEQLGTAAGQLKEYQQRLYYSKDTLSIMTQMEQERWGMPGVALRHAKDALIAAYQERDGLAAERVCQELAEMAQSLRCKPDLFVAEVSRLIGELEHAAGYESERAAFHQLLLRTQRLSDTMALAGHRLRHIFHDAGGGQLAAMQELKLHVIEQYIRDHLAENLTSVSVANYLYLNPSYFSRYFKRLTGEKFTDYLHRYKMRIAMQMLKNKEETVEVVSIRLGYSDRTYFSKVFKKYSGMSPVEYKANAAKY